MSGMVSESLFRGGTAYPGPIGYSRRLQYIPVPSVAQLSVEFPPAPFASCGPP